MRKLGITMLAFLAAVAVVSAQPGSKPLESSACHIFIDYHFIWTLEVIENHPEGLSKISDWGKITVTPLRMVSFDYSKV